MDKIKMDYDVVVIGAGPGGLPAAIAAARLGAKVIVLERNGFLGGNLASGLPLLAFLDRNGNRVTGGIAQEFIDRLIELGGSYGHARCPMHNSVTIVQPELMKIVAIEKVKEAGADVLLHCEFCDVDVQNGKIRSVTMVGKGQKFEISGKVFIDATGDGDVAYAAGAEYWKGLKDDGVLQPPTVLFTLGGVNQSVFFDYLDKNPQEFTYPESMQVGPGYNPDFFRRTPSHVFLGLKNFLDGLREKGECPVDRDTLIFINSPNPDQVVVNSIRLLGIDGSDPRDLTNGELKGQLQILKLVETIKEYLPGFENCYVASITPSLGVRESRRIAGVKKLTIDEVLAGEIPADSIALGSYKVDIHSGTGADTRLETLEKPYGIPYGCLNSKDFSNLMLTGRCISMDSPTLGSARIMPTCMAIGQAAGIGAALAVRESSMPNDVDVDAIRSILLSDGAILYLEQKACVTV